MYERVPLCLCFLSEVIMNEYWSVWLICVYDSGGVCIHVYKEDWDKQDGAFRVWLVASCGKDSVTISRLSCDYANIKQRTASVGWLKSEDGVSQHETYDHVKHLLTWLSCWSSVMYTDKINVHIHINYRLICFLHHISSDFFVLSGRTEGTQTGC